jgi:hypothetical protein
MVTIHCDNCGAETSAYPPANHTRHEPYCDKCYGNYLEKQKASKAAAKKLAWYPDVVVRKCGQLRKVLKKKLVPMEDNSTVFLYQVDRAGCDKSCDSYSRCAGAYSCGFMLREDEVLVSRPSTLDRVQSLLDTVVGESIDKDLVQAILDHPTRELPVPTRPMWDEAGSKRFLDKYKAQGYTNMVSLGDGCGCCEQYILALELFREFKEKDGGSDER